MRPGDLKKDKYSLSSVPVNVNERFSLLLSSLSNLMPFMCRKCPSIDEFDVF